MEYKVAVGRRDDLRMLLSNGPFYDLVIDALLDDVMHMGGNISVKRCVYKIDRCNRFMSAGLEVWWDKSSANTEGSDRITIGLFDRNDSGFIDIHIDNKYEKYGNLLIPFGQTINVYTTPCGSIHLYDEKDTYLFAIDYKANPDYRRLKLHKISEALQSLIINEWQHEDDVIVINFEYLRGDIDKNAAEEIDSKLLDTMEPIVKTGRPYIR